MSRGVRIAVTLGGALVLCCVVIFGMLGTAFLHSKDPAAGQRVAAKIANFSVPQGFRIARGLDLGLMSQVTLISTDRTKPMMIILEGMFMAASKDAVDQGIFSSMKARCAKIIALDSDQLMVNHELFTFRRIRCTGKTGKQDTYEYGSFAGKAPVVTLMAIAPTSTWDPTPIHALLRSLH